MRIINYSSWRTEAWSSVHLPSVECSFGSSRPKTAFKQSRNRNSILLIGDVILRKGVEVMWDFFSEYRYKIWNHQPFPCSLRGLVRHGSVGRDGRHLSHFCLTANSPDWGSDIITANVPVLLTLCSWKLSPSHVTNSKPRTYPWSTGDQITGNLDDWVLFPKITWTN